MFFNKQTRDLVNDKEIEIMNISRGPTEQKTVSTGTKLAISFISHPGNHELENKKEKDMGITCRLPYKKDLKRTSIIKTKIL